MKKSNLLNTISGLKKKILSLAAGVEMLKKPKNLFFRLLS